MNAYNVAHNQKINDKERSISLEDFTQKVIRHIQAIPFGHVATYGQIAKVSGNNRGARQVARILHTMSQKHQLPWHRVVNAKGEISHTGSEQRELLEMEDVEFSLHGKINLTHYQYQFPQED